MVQVTWTRRARTDLDGISAYVAQGSAFYAERLEKDISTRLAQIRFSQPRYRFGNVEIQARVALTQQVIG
jgi:plasmid stabilization system protein ParE